MPRASSVEVHSESVTQIESPGTPKSLHENEPLKDELQETRSYIKTQNGRIKVEGIYTRDKMLIVSVLKQFSADLRENTDAMKALTDALAPNKSVSMKVMVERFQQTYEISSLHQLLDRQNNVTKSISTIFRRFFEREVIMGFTAMKKMPGKVLLKTTNFGDCMLAALKEFHTHLDGSALNDEYVLRCVGNAISNAKDWDGRRPTQKQ